MAAKIFSHPVHYKNERGVWEDINLNLCDCKKWEFTGEVISNVYRSYFGDSTDENIHLASVEFVDKNKEMWINFKLKDAKPKEIVKNKNRCSFVECFPNVDVEYIVLPEKLKENIILKEKVDMREFEFTLKYDRIIIERNEEGGLIIKDKENEKILWNITRPFMKDAEGNVSFGVMYELDHDGEFDVFRVVIDDEKFLNEAKYPIYIDPTTEFKDASKIIDAHISTASLHSSRNYGSLDYIAIGSSYDDGSSGYNSRHAIIHFLDINNLGGDKTINKVLLNLYAYFSRISEDIIADLHIVTSDWDELTVTYRDSPDISDNSFGSVVFSDVNKWYVIDVTEAYLSPSFGVFFNRIGSSSNHYRFYSSESEHVELRPYLYVEFLQKPTLGFHDGSVSGGYYTDSSGEVFKYLDFGILTAGQTSLAQAVYLRNLSGFPITDLQIYLDTSEFPENTIVELSESNNPFIGSDRLHINGTFEDNEDIRFYVRVSTNENAKAGGNFRIYAKATPV